MTKARSTAQKQSSQQTKQLAQKLGQSIGLTLKSALLPTTGNPSPPSQGERQDERVLPLPLGEGRGEGSNSHTQLTAHSDEIIQSNRRLADSLKKRAGVGDLPRFTSDAINTDSNKAIPEIIDLIEQVHANDPAQADELLARTRDGLSGDNRTAFDRAVVEMREPYNDPQPTADPGSEEDGEVPDDPGQDDPEDPCAKYQHAVAEATAEVEEIEARADELEQEIAELANKVMEMEREKQKVLNTLSGMRVHYLGGRIIRNPFIKGANTRFGQRKEEYLRKRAELIDRLTALNAAVRPIRRKMAERADMRKALTPKLAQSRSRLAQAKADLRKCEG